MNKVVLSVAWLWLTSEGQWEVYSLRPSLVEGETVMLWSRIPCKSGPEALAVRDRINEKAAAQAKG